MGWSPAVVFEAVGDRGRLIVFEGGEGAGSQGLPDASPYGLSKAHTSRTFQYYCARSEIGLGKFVIPNPFGPLEEARFTTYLARTWLAGKPACVATPALRYSV